MRNFGWPLVGRTKEMARLAELRRSGRGALLAGAAGAGKTRLAAESAGAALDEGWHVVSIVASRTAANIPLGAFAPVLPPNSSLLDVGAPALVQARAAFEKAAAGRPLLLHVDDVQWLDEGSALLLHQLAGVGGATVVGTLRTGEPCPETVLALWKDGIVERLDIPALRQADVLDLLERVLDGPVDAESASALWDRCRGNVLFLRELLGEAQRQGLVTSDDGRWHIVVPSASSARLYELVQDRLAHLGRGEWQVLEVIALAEPIPVDVLERIAKPGAAERLEEQGLLALVQDGRRLLARLAHPIYGDITLSSLPESRRRRLLRALSDALEATGARRREDVLRLAVWRLDSGGAVPPATLLAAARQAHFAFHTEMAERLARAAHDADPSFESAHVLVDVLYERGRFEEREALLVALAAPAGDDEQRAVVAMARAIGLFWGLGDAEQADHVLVEAEAVVHDRTWWGEMQATRATLASQGGDQRRALELLDEIERPFASVRVEAQAALAAAFALPGVGRGEDALALIDDAMSHRSAVGPQLTMYQIGLLAAARSMACVTLGRLDEAEGVAAFGLEAAKGAGDYSGRGFFASTLAWVAFNQGRLTIAEQLYRDAVASFAVRAHRGPSRWALIGVLLAAVQTGDLEVGREARRALDEIGRHPAGLFETSERRGRAWTLMIEGDIDGGRAALEDAATAARARGNVADEAVVLHDVACLGAAAAAAVAPRLRALAGSAQGALAPLLADHADALAAADPDALGAVSERFAALGFSLRAADAARAAAAATSNDLRSAARWVRRAAELASSDQTVGVPSGPLASLSVREREIAELASRGVPSKEIAGQLFLSVRTVDNHLGRVYTKLGVKSRGELAEVLETILVSGAAGGAVALDASLDARQPR